jgi:predicted transposase YbfD/YdcC
MKINKEAVTRYLGRKSLIMQKHAPQGMFVLGIAGTVVSTVLACRATLKLADTLDDIKKEMDSVPPLQGHRQHQKNMSIVYINGTYKLVKLYAPALIIGTASIGCLASSHVTLNRRNTSLTAAYSALQMSYEAYRDRVRKELGEEKELELYHAVEMEKLGKGGEVQDFPRADPNSWSPYAKFFDEYNKNWKKSPEQNRMFVQCQQNYLNHLLHVRGHVFLNEAYDQLGIDRTSAGQVVGWVYGNGDNFIDFGLFEAGSSMFINGFERSIILDFNVDGPIWDLL